MLKRGDFKSDGTYGFLIGREVRSLDTLAVSRQSRRLKTILRVQAPYARSQILGRRQKEARVARPLNALDSVKMPGQIAVQNERRKLEFSIVIGPRGLRRMPQLQASAHSDGKMTA